jgi:hypothetical protein
VKRFWLGIWAIIKSFKSWQGLVSFGLATLLTGGWAYILLGLGGILGNAWMISVGTAGVTFWWLPVTPGIPLTVGLAVVIQRFIFKDKTALTKEQILNKFEMKRGEHRGLQKQGQEAEGREEKII